MKVIFVVVVVVIVIMIVTIVVLLISLRRRWLLLPLPLPLPLQRRPLLLPIQTARRLGTDLQFGADADEEVEEVRLK